MRRYQVHQSPLPLLLHSQPARPGQPEDRRWGELAELHWGERLLVDVEDEDVTPGWFFCPCGPPLAGVMLTSPMCRKLGGPGTFALCPGAHDPRRAPSGPSQELVKHPWVS